MMHDVPLRSWSRDFFYTGSRGHKNTKLWIPGSGSSTLELTVVVLMFETPRNIVTFMLILIPKCYI